MTPRSRRSHGHGKAAYPPEGSRPQKEHAAMETYHALTPEQRAGYHADRLERP